MSSPAGSSPDRATLLRALLLAERSSVDLTHIALDTLGGESASNRDVEVLLTIRALPDSTPGELARTTGLATTAVSRALRHLEDEGLITRHPGPTDARSSPVRLSGRGHARISRFERAARDYFDSAAPLVKEVLSLIDHDRQPETQTASVLEVLLAVARVGAAYADEVRSVLDPYGVTHEHERFAVTLLLDRGAARPSHLADDLRLSRPTVSALMHRLSEVGIVSMGHDDPLDRRAVVIQLTERGMQAANAQLDVFERHSSVMCAALAMTQPPSSLT